MTQVELFVPCLTTQRDKLSATRWLRLCAVVAFTNGESGPKVYERVIAGVTGHDQAAFLWL